MKTTNLFFGCSDAVAVKLRYDTLTLVYQQEVEMIKMINDQYSKLMLVLSEPKPVEVVNEKSSVSDKLKELMEKVDTSELGTEVLGSWLWVTKKTFPIKDVLKSLGFRYSANKMAWYYRSDENRSGNQDPISLDMIRAKYGTVVAQ